MKFTTRTALLAFTMICGFPALHAQEPAAESKPESKPAAKPESRSESSSFKPYVDTSLYKTFYLKYDGTQSDGNEILTAVRLLVEPSVKLYLTPSQKSISVRGTEAQLALIQRIFDDLDRPKKVYLIAYTIHESDGGKRIGSQRFAFTASSGQRATLKQGSKVPIVTGSYNSGTKDVQQQMTYLDIGFNFDATPEDLANGVSLKSKVEQSTVAPEPSGVGATDPIIRQSVLENVSTIPLGKQTDIGSMDVPGSTRHLDIEVQVDLVK